MQCFSFLTNLFIALTQRSESKINNLLRGSDFQYIMNIRAFTYRLHLLASAHAHRWIKLGTVSFVLCAMLASCENDIEKVKNLSNSEDLPAIMAQGYEVLYSDSTVIRRKLQTPEMIIHRNQKEPYTEFPQGVAITQYDAQMNVVSYITSQYAKYYEAEERWEAKNNVIAVNLNGDTLKTEFLIWDLKKGKIFSDQFVKIIQKDQITTGTSFESNQDFTEYSFRNLKGQIYVDVQEN